MGGGSRLTSEERDELVRGVRAGGDVDRGVEARERADLVTDNLPGDPEHERSSSSGSAVGCPVARAMSHECVAVSSKLMLIPAVTGIGPAPMLTSPSSPRAVHAARVRSASVRNWVPMSPSSAIALTSGRSGWPATPLPMLMTTPVVWARRSRTTHSRHGVGAVELIGLDARDHLARVVERLGERVEQFHFGSSVFATLALPAPM